MDEPGRTALKGFFKSVMKVCEEDEAAEIIVGALESAAQASNGDEVMLRERVAELNEEIGKSHAKARAEITRVSTENQKLTEAGARADERNNRLSEENQKLRDEITELIEENEPLRAAVELRAKPNTKPQWEMGGWTLEADGYKLFESPQSRNICRLELNYTPSDTQPGAVTYIMRRDFPPAAVAGLIENLASFAGAFGERILKDIHK